MARNVKIGSVIVGEGQPTLFMPEIGVLFKQDVGLARESIQAVKDAGCDVIKGEVWHTADVILDDGYELAYETQQGLRKQNYRKFVEDVLLPLPVWRQLFMMCHDLGLSTVVSAYDPVAIDFLVDIGAACVKLASPNIVNLPLLRHAARSGLPIMLDSGKANLSEIVRAVEWLREAGCQNLIVNHTPDGHPCAAEDHHLRIIETLRGAFDCPIGLSDHYAGLEILYAATGLGYDVLEKPVVKDPKEGDWGSPWSMPIGRIAEVRAAVMACSAARGQRNKQKRFAANSHVARSGIVTNRAVKAGELITLDTVRTAWPCHGISVADWDLVEGGTFARDFEADRPLSWQDIVVAAR